MYGAAMAIFICATSYLCTASRPCSTQSNSMTRSPPGDVLYDLAFLLMDLEERRLRPAAYLLLKRYLWWSDEAYLNRLPALPLFLSMRSAIRARVIAAGLSHLNGEGHARAAPEARRYFWCAEEFLK